MNQPSFTPERPSVTVGCSHGSAKAEIKQPRDNEMVDGTVRVKGTAQAPGFICAKLSFAPQANPQDRTPIADISSPVTNGKLGDWDTTGTTDGDYLLTLEVLTSSGTAASDTIGVKVDNQAPALAFASPTDGGVVTSPFTVTGSVEDAHLSTWKLTRESVSPRLLAHLDGDTRDEVSGRRGAGIGHPRYTEGKFAQGLRITQGQGLTYPCRDAINPESGTVEMWVIPSWTGDDQTDRTLFCSGALNGHRPKDGLLITKGPSSITFTAYDRDGRERSCSLGVDGTSLPADTPFHLAASWDDGGLSLSVNGFTSTECEGPGTGKLSFPRERIWIGCDPQHGSSADAVFDELVIYDYARTLQSIRTDCLAGSPKTLGDSLETVASGHEPVVDSVLGSVSTTSGEGESLTLALTAKDKAGRKSFLKERLWVDCSAPTAEITAPDEGAELEGHVQVRGTAFDMDLASCEVAIKQGSSPAAPGGWTTLASGTSAVWRDTLASFDTAGLAQGDHILRLIVHDLSGKASEAYRHVAVKASGPPLVEIASPAAGRAVDLPSEVTGTVRSQTLDSWRLSCTTEMPLFLAHFDGNTTNERDGSQGTISGSPSYADGKFAQGILMSDGDLLAYPTQGNISLEEGTLEMWVVPGWSGSDGRTRTFFYTSSTGSGEFTNVMITGSGDGALNFSIVETLGAYRMLRYPVDDSAITQGVPFHLAATWNRGDMKLYLNGVESGATPVGSGSGTLPELGQSLFVGSLGVPGTSADAIIDEVTIWERARDAATIAEDLFASAPRAYEAGPVELASGTAPIENSRLGTLTTEGLPGDRLELRLEAKEQSGNIIEDEVALCVDSASPRAGITSPVAGQLVYGNLEVRGTASDIDMASSRLLFKQGADPNGPGDWTIAATSSTPVYKGLICTWDASAAPEGPANIFLEVSDAQGKVSSSDPVLVNVNNHVPTAAISSPGPDGGAPESCAVTGTAAGENFSSWKLEFKEGTEPGGTAEWVSIAEGREDPVTDGLLATWDTTGLAEGSFLLRLTVYGVPGMEIVATHRVFVDHTTPTALITSPAADETHAGLLRVAGTASDERFEGYRLECKEASEPKWHLLKELTNPITAGTLGWWDNRASRRWRLRPAPQRARHRGP